MIFGTVQATSTAALRWARRVAPHRRAISKEYYTIEIERASPLPLERGNYLHFLRASVRSQGILNVSVWCSQVDGVGSVWHEIWTVT
jgi:hypothetical protein